MPGGFDYQVYQRIDSETDEIVFYWYWRIAGASTEVPLMEDFHERLSNDQLAGIELT
ncbi:hypothetical protein ACTID9_21995 [Brevibacillus fluminis]|uniref:hypothetical protein n=1 Tax=Brevibacillus fluminis TaxID=511487 RepID=UPI003F89B8B2